LATFLLFRWKVTKKPAWDVIYAEKIYDGLVAHNDFGDINALKLRIPTTLHQAYQNKILLQREMICFVALMEVANPQSGLQPVMLAFGDLLVGKILARGLQINRDQLADAALKDVKRMFSEPFKWAQNWLASSAVIEMIITWCSYSLTIESKASNYSQERSPGPFSPGASVRRHQR
jgi:hypothetical protein